jgi:hypothetical protein
MNLRARPVPSQPTGQRTSSVTALRLLLIFSLCHEHKTTVTTNNFFLFEIKKVQGNPKYSV